MSMCGNLEDLYSRMELIALLSYREEMIARKEHQKEYRRNYYAKKRAATRKTLLRAREELLDEDDTLQYRRCLSETRDKNGNPNSLSTSLSDSEIMVSLEKENQSRTRGRRLFDSNGLIMLYCKTCDKTTQKINYVRITHCEECKEELKYQCVKCQKLYKYHTSCREHLKLKHPTEDPEF